MNVGGQLQQFFVTVAKDTRIHSGHICLYVGLLHYWIESGWHNPLSISRRKMMGVCKIRSQATYHKYIMELHAYGYIRYLPSNHPRQGSLIYFVDLL